MKKSMMVALMVGVSLLCVSAQAGTVFYMSFDDNLGVYHSELNHDWGSQEMKIVGAKTSFSDKVPMDESLLPGEPYHPDLMSHFQRTGSFGKSILFDLTMDDVDTSSGVTPMQFYDGAPIEGDLAGENLIGDFTFECWCNWNSLVQNNSEYQTIQLGNMNTNSYNISLRYNAPAHDIVAGFWGQLDPCSPLASELLVQDPNNTDFIYEYSISGGRAMSYTWHHIALTYQMGDDTVGDPIDPNTWDYGILKLYEDGVEVASREDITPGVVLRDTWNGEGVAPFIGCSGQYRSNFGGYVDDVRLSDEIIRPDFTGDPNFPELGTPYDTRSGFWGVLSSDPLFCGDYPTMNKGDMNRNCMIDLEDFAAFATDWAECTMPYVNGCKKQWLQSYVAEKVGTSSITLDGNFNDWASDMEWLPVTSSQVMYPEHDAMIGPDSEVAVCWDDNDYLYMAVKIEDPCHYLQVYDGWDQQDHLEVYVQASAEQEMYGFWWLEGDPEVSMDPNYMRGQQFIIGVAADEINDWAVWGDAGVTDPDPEPSTDILEYAARKSGDYLYYEVKVKAYEQYNRPETSGRAVKTLAPGEQVAFDCNVVDRYGNAVDDAGMASFYHSNGKFKIGASLMLWELVNDYEDLPCGYWGYLGTDFNKDCYVDIGDIAEMSANWLVETWPMP